MYRQFLLYLLLISIPGGVVAQDAVQEGRLDAQQVKELISGNTVECYHKKKKFSYIIYFAPDGAALGISTDLRERKATWQVSDDGYHCVHWSDKAAPICHGIFPNGDGSYQRKKRGSNKSGITMKRVEVGNPYNF